MSGVELIYKETNQWVDDFGKMWLRSACTCMLEWVDHLNIEYDPTSCDKDPFERHQMALVLPFWVGRTFSKGLC